MGIEIPLQSQDTDFHADTDFTVRVIAGMLNLPFLFDGVYHHRGFWHTASRQLHNHNRREHKNYS